MPVRPTDRCGLKDCDNRLTPGAADVGFDIEGKVHNIRICSKHAWVLMTAPRGTFMITPDRKLKQVPPPPIVL